MTVFILLRDITAEDLAMDSIDSYEGHPPAYEGYPSEAVIGPKGTMVRQTAESDNDADDAWGSVEVEEFANDPFAIGFVSLSDLKEVK